MLDRETFGHTGGEVDSATEPAFSRLNGAVDFYFVRHGESEANRQRRIAGKENTPLTEMGRLQAAATGRWFTGKPISAVFTSPLGRAAETAKIIATIAGLPEPQEDARVAELDTGIFSGLSFEEISKRFPGEYAEFRARSWDAVPGAESALSLRGRAVAFWNDLVAAANAGNASILTATHGGMLQWLIKATVGGTRWIPVFTGSNCGIFHFRVTGSRAADGRSDRLPDNRSSYFAEWRLMNYRPPEVVELG